ncbi:MAG: FAD-dependent oxidoreductase [Eubacteriales bacterium]
MADCIKRRERVTLYEMKPKKYSPAHSSEQFAELICSNSFKADRVESAAGLLKEEMRRFHSLLMECADQCRVPAGGALAVRPRAFFPDGYRKNQKQSFDKGGI